ncbi:hypothetical protein AVEN_240869-1 [Araneus ventricosus]|uniref:Uncharacterized protein n=1 Tax=Araneus ventricosus TaxID=182803 RepID=A0A4Y2MQ07_ARAVE|nr:hypothetical protein AVEN_240869-1 [Araneus ventricosus]
MQKESLSNTREATVASWQNLGFEWVVQGFNSRFHEDPWYITAWGTLNSVLSKTVEVSKRKHCRLKCRPPHPSLQAELEITMSVPI